MSLETFKDRHPENKVGKIYVDTACLDCDLCRENAPTIFKRDDHEGCSYVYNQPSSDQELELARQAIDWCCVEAIHDDGEAYDWSIPPASLKENSIPYDNKSRYSDNVTPTSLGASAIQIIRRLFRKHTS
jgi:ferredoxin